ncbi:hypothetical protein ACRE_058910 [Hapsidospora chrysogenum ATCC 11550]|uniref:Non-homologous end-joining factor 1 n=1 Tax=Hapsidospora chrysogenum (strain ATCC 11550 / CBS 779.69 / DSM 880 / IAM 14645 / JCM 23072 / IMI 49137) TaxID=857340 RepID=A0A086T1W5_HAPC1|nr:hypothetical protein ACRE_058910 [Hapsidospora chrysogenum ATCC 11550]
MTVQSTWRPLPLPESSGVPVLLASIDTDTAAYTVRVTDMANMWVESLDRKAICMRGWGENTSIDPSDTPENMSKLLSTIRSALDLSDPAHQDTSMSLAPASPSDAGEGGLTLRLTCRLPGLQPLKWPVHLRKAAPSSIATALVLPLIQAHHSRIREIESLAALLAQKDGVITKLLDKLEATGTGLEHVFNTLSGKKKVNRSVAEDRVRGLAPFHRKQWQTDMGHEEGPDSAASLVRDVFSAGGLRHHGSLEVEDSPKLDRWWLDLKGTLQISQRSLDTDAHQGNKGQTPPANDTEEDDDFQVQETPPHLAPTTAHKPSSKALPIDDASTASETDDSNVSPSRSGNRRYPTKPPEKTKPVKPARKVGTIGGRKQSSPRRCTSPRTLRETQERGGIQVTKSDAASDVADKDNDTDSTADPSPPSSSPKRTVAKKGRLGRIGGQRGATQGAQQDNEQNVEEASGKKSETATSHTPRLGMVGKRKEAKASTPPADGIEDGRGRSPRRESPRSKHEPRETSTERADRRREELKRELEKKAAAGPVKKRRKF